MRRTLQQNGSAGKREPEQKTMPKIWAEEPSKGRPNPEAEAVEAVEQVAPESAAKGMPQPDD